MPQDWRFKVLTILLWSQDSLSYKINFMTVWGKYEFGFSNIEMQHYQNSAKITLLSTKMKVVENVDEGHFCSLTTSQACFA